MGFQGHEAKKASFISSFSRKWAAVAVFFLVLAVDSSTAHALGRGRSPSSKPGEPTLDHPTSSGDFTLRVLSYNVQGLPSPIGGSWGRMADIGKILYQMRMAGTAPHVVAIQEAWFENKSEPLLRESKYPYVFRGPGANFGKIVGAGLLILSEFPISEAAESTYSDCSFTDCLATKGVVRVRVHIDGLPEPLYLFDTHLQADNDPFIPVSTSQAVRRAQIREEESFRKAVNPKAVPTIFVGDFNFHPKDGDYKFFKSTTPFQSAHEYCIETDSCSGDSHFEIVDDYAKSYDHSFFLSTSRVSIRPTHLARTFKEQPHGEPLSDHPALETHYHISW